MLHGASELATAVDYTWLFVLHAGHFSILHLEARRLDSARIAAWLSLPMMEKSWGQSGVVLRHGHVAR